MFLFLCYFNFADNESITAENELLVRVGAGPSSLVGLAKGKGKITYIFKKPQEYGDIVVFEIAFTNHKVEYIKTAYKGPW